jgi:hypothetical protein
MQRLWVGMALTALVLAPGVGARPMDQSGTYPQPCATIAGPPWTQTINLTANLPPPKTARLRVLRGNRYYVFVDHVSCAWARTRASQLMQFRTSARVGDAAPSGYLCSAGSRHWFRDGFNGDAVRRTYPPTSMGGCSTQKTSAVPGETYRTFWWTPAKPCRPDFTTDTCR